MKCPVASLLTLLLHVAFTNDASAFVSPHDDLVAEERDVEDNNKYNAKMAASINNKWISDLPKNAPLTIIRDQKTVMCPAVAQDLYSGHTYFGGRTRLIMKNTASDPVVVAFVEHDGSEVSAANANIAPAQSDPNAVLAPGQTKVFSVQEGHVFHVRNPITGELLMQHRAGIIPIENRYNQEIICSPDEEDDMQNSTSSGRRPSFRLLRKFQEWKPFKMEQYDQEVEFDVGFRNSIQSSSSGKICAVNMYFVKKQDENPRRKPNYVERFKLHLGANQLVTVNDDLWDANTKFEQSFLGHEFAVRLAANDNVVVDYIALGPIKVHDCADDKKRNAASKSAAAAAHIAVSKMVVIPVGDAVEAMHNNNVTASHPYYEAFVTHNTTESRRGLYFQMHTE